MRILSIDVGVKNLAFCQFEKLEDSNHFNIIKWDVINLTQEEDTAKCCFLDKNIPCNKPAKYTINKNNDILCFCLKHSKKQEYQIPSSDLKASFINKQKIQKLIEIADKYDISYEKPIKKNDLVFKINEYIANKCFKEITSVNASYLDLITIGKNIKTKLNKIFPASEKIDYILIENQISPIANRMKTIQGMLAQYFIMNNNAERIEFVSSIHKLKVTYNNTNEKSEKTEKSDKKEKCENIIEKKDYKDRKKLGITKCLEILSNDHRFNDKLDFFNQHKKKDDLSDSFLQGLWFINEKL